MTILSTSLLAILLVSPQDDFHSLFVKGLKALNDRDLPAAQTSLLAASRLQPSNPRVQVALAQTYRRLRKTALAAAAAQRAERLGVDDPVTLRALATFYSEERNFARAGDIEARCAMKDRQDQAAIARGMSDYLLAHLPRKAIALALAVSGWEERADIRNLLGKAYEADGQILKTLPELQAAIRLSPDDESYWFDLMQTLLNHYNFEAASQVGEESRKGFPGSAQIALATGVAYYGQSRSSAAVEEFLDSIALDPGNEQPYFFLSRLLNEAHDQLPAIAQRFTEYEATHPESYLGWFLHAKVLIAEGNEPEPAESLLKKSISLDGKYWESHYLLGILLTNRSALVDAEREFRRSTELNPRDPATHYRLFRALAALGKTQEAEAELALQRKVSAEYQADFNRKTGEIKRLEFKRSEAPGK